MPHLRSKLVVIKPGALGDTLLLAPGLRALRESLPGLWITVVGSAPAVDLLTYLKAADEVIGIDRLNLYAPSEAEGKLMRGAQVLTFIPLEGRLRRRLMDIARPAGITISSSRPERPGPHMAVHLHQCLRVGFSPMARLSTAPFQCPQADLDARMAPFAVLAPGAGADDKRAPLSIFDAAAGEMARKGIQPIFLAGDVEIEKGLIHHYPKSYRCCRNPDLKQLAVLMQRAEAVVANDSGPAHLAGLLGADTTVYFGPTDPAIWQPWGPRVSIVRF